MCFKRVSEIRETYYPTIASKINFKKIPGHCVKDFLKFAFTYLATNCR